MAAMDIVAAAIREEEEKESASDSISIDPALVSEPDSESETGLLPAPEVVASALKEQLKKHKKKKEKKHKGETIEGKVQKKPHRWRNGTKAKMDIRREQKSTKAAIPKAPFNLVVREILEKVARENGNEDGYKVSQSAFFLLQSDWEDFSILVSKYARKICESRRQVTIKPADIYLAIDIVLDMGQYQTTLQQPKKRSTVQRD